MPEILNNVACVHRIQWNLPRKSNKYPERGQCCVVCGYPLNVIEMMHSFTECDSFVSKCGYLNMSN